MKAPDPTDIQALYGPTARYKRVSELKPGDVLILGRAGQNVRRETVCSVAVNGSRVVVETDNLTMQEASNTSWAIVSV